MAGVLPHDGATMFKTGEYSDLVITCKSDGKGVEFALHRVLICSQSPILKELCDKASHDVSVPPVLETDEFLIN